MVLDLDEIFIYFYYDGVLRFIVWFGMFFDFIFKVVIDKYFVWFFVYKRFYVDFFLEVVS